MVKATRAIFGVAIIIIALLIACYLCLTLIKVIIVLPLIPAMLSSEPGYRIGQFIGFILMAWLCYWLFKKGIGKFKDKKTPHNNPHTSS